MDLDAVEAAVAAIAPGNEVRSWRSLLPMLTDMLSMVDVALWIVGAIFFLAAGLGVMNTMLMATYDRMREFGVTKALGASPWRIARDVAIEAGTLAVLATMAGAAAGLAACLLFARYGIDMSAFGGSISFAGVAFDPVWRTRFDLSYAPGPMAAMWAVCIVAALYPAALAARLEPVDAMRRR
jgi:ABC-type antimicrobial peptide transport system permease subunit